MANGELALYYNQYAGYNTAVGYSALYYNDSTGTGNAENNCAFGSYALWSNGDGSSNSAFGFSALSSNDTGFDNTGMGTDALLDNVDGLSNTAVGAGSLVFNISGSYNTAIGDSAGANITGGGNVCIGYAMRGVSGQDNRTWISNVYDDVATTRTVYVDSDGHLGTLSSSRRYKEEIQSMEKASETLFALRPVTFRYRKDVDPGRARSFGLIAEEVAQVSPDLITCDKEGKPYSVRYEQVNAMLLNEFLKEHRKVEQLTKDFESKLAQQQKQIEALTAGLQKVSAQLEASKPAPQVVNNP